jgi:hypothetical protein
MKGYKNGKYCKGDIEVLTELGGYQNNRVSSVFR